MIKKTTTIIGLTLISLLLFGCRRGGETSTSSVSTTTNTSQTTGSASSSSGTSTRSDTSFTGTTSSVTSSGTSSTSHTTSSHSTSSEPEPGNYYASISDNLSGDSLRKALHSLNVDHLDKLVTYEGMKTFGPICDVNPDNPNEMIGFYDNARLPAKWDSAKTWNREHVWPNARGGDRVEDDAFMPRPCSTKINSSRGSKGYGLASYDPYTDSKITNKVAYYRGVCARIIFYCMIANLNLKLSDDIFDKDYGSGSPKDTMATISDLLQWNLDYLPTNTSFGAEDDLARRVEINRNEVIYSHKDGQGNRNPFVDHPSYACRIWGTYNNKTRSICGM